MKKVILAICALGLVVACEGGYYFPETPGDYSKEMADDGGMPSPNGGGESQGMPGVVTAGEWNDLDNWAFWGRLMNTKGDEQTEGYAQTCTYWGFWNNRRVAVKVNAAANKAVAGVKVKLKDGDKVIWTAITDNLGRADCWIGLHDPDYQSGTLSIALNGKAMEGSPAVTSWNDESVAMNEYTFSADAPDAKADILFIVDSTGSMSDEIDFLKEDLMDILKRASKADLPISIRTGALFYRDTGLDEEYLTRKSAFTKDFNTTINFIKQQNAAGGGDFPEAVHTALEKSLQSFDWNKKARARIAFILLDAPPHQDHQGVLESIHKSIDTYAEMGIKLIPVASSGIDKETEFILRMMAIATEGTYVFITNDSGVGESHIEATVGEYQVEKLNDLLVRLIKKYLE